MEGPPHPGPLPRSAGERERASGDRAPPAVLGEAERAAFAAIDAAMRRHQFRPDALIEVLHVAERELGFLPEEALLHVARGLRLPPSRVWGVATFYNLFTLRPRPAHACTVCMGTACWVRGAEALLRAAEEASRGAKAPPLPGPLPGAAGERADSGPRPPPRSAEERERAAPIGVGVVRCIGACGGAPVVAYDGQLVGQEREDGVRARLAGWSAP